MKTKMKERIKETVPASLLISFTFYIFGVLEMYITNIDEFWFSMGDLLISTFPVFILSMAMLILVGVLLKDRPRKYYVALVFGLGLALYIQGNFLNTDFGVLDGKSIDWSQFKKEQIISTSLWVLLPVASLILAKLKPVLCKSIIIFVSIVIVVTQAVTLVVSFIPVMGLENAKNNESRTILTTDGEFKLSKNENVIVFVVDTLDTKYVQDLLNEEPAYADKLDGFVFYDDVLSTYGYTKPSIPFFLTGKQYLNEQPYDEYLKEAFADSEVLNTLAETGFHVGVFTESGYVGKSEVIQNQHVAKVTVDSPLKLASKFSELIAFRYFPQLLKPYFLVYSGEFNTNKGIKNTYILNDPAFYQRFVESGIRAETNDPVFRFYHLFGTHAPYSMDENAAYCKEGSSLKQQIRGVMKILFEYFEQMKDNGIYDDATIVIMSDHGYENLRSNAAVLIKMPKEHGELKVCSTPVSYIGELPKTMLYLLGTHQKEDGTFFDKTLTDQRGRYFYNTVSGRENHPSYYMDLCEYIAYGHASDESSFVPTGLIYSSTGSTNNLFPYQLGSTLGAIDCLSATTHGYHKTENDTIYSRGTSSSLLLHLDRIPTKNLKLTLNTTWSMLWPSQISLYVNQNFVSTECASQDKGEIAFIIPQEFVKNNDIYLLFEYPGIRSLIENYKIESVTDIYSFEWESVVLEETDDEFIQSVPETKHAMELGPRIVNNGEVTEMGTIIHTDGMMHGYYMRLPEGEYYLTVAGDNLEKMSVSIQGNDPTGASASISSELIKSGEGFRVYKFTLGQLTKNTNFVFYNTTSEDFVVKSILLCDYNDE